MPAQILDGKAIAADIRQRIRGIVDDRVRAGLRPPGLAVVLVGDDPASDIYVRHKERDCQEVGFYALTRRFPASVSQGSLLEAIDALNAAEAIDGVLVQLPLPAHVNPDTIIERIAPDKDVDGYHPYNIGRLAHRSPSLRPCTPKGIMTLLAQTGLRLRGMDAVIVGASNHVGRPMGLELLLAGCTVTTTHKFTRETQRHVQAAQVVIAAAGRAQLVRGDWIAEGAVVIDVGITRQADGSLIGDVEFDRAKERAAWITPVPGGVGPMTRAALLENTLQAALDFH